MLIRQYEKGVVLALIILSFNVLNLARLSAGAADYSAEHHLSSIILLVSVRLVVSSL